MIHNADEFTKTFITVLENKYVVEAGACALVMAERSGDHTNAKPWKQFFTRMLHVFMCRSPADECIDCLSPVPASFVNTACVSFEMMTEQISSLSGQTPAVNLS